MSEILLTDEKKEYIRSQYEKIKMHIDSISKREIVLLAATKTQPAEVINFAINELGITDIGENRVQELLEKYDAIDKEKVNIHFIGRLQTNKVKYIIDKVCLIHSVDSEKLAMEIDRRAAAIGKVMDVLIEINTGSEESKGGVEPEKAVMLAEKIRSMEHLNLKGIMAVAPKCDEKSKYVDYFSQTYKIFVDIFTNKQHNIYDKVLSMGMSDSYEQAIECGSNLIRLGSALFGARQ